MIYKSSYRLYFDLLKVTIHNNIRKRVPTISYKTLYKVDDVLEYLKNDVNRFLNINNDLFNFDNIRVKEPIKIFDDQIYSSGIYGYRMKKPQDDVLTFEFGRTEEVNENPHWAFSTITFYSTKSRINDLINSIRVFFKGKAIENLYHKDYVANGNINIRALDDNKIRYRIYENEEEDLMLE